MKRSLVWGWVFFYLIGVMNCGSSKPAKPIETPKAEPKVTRPTPTTPKPMVKDTTTVQQPPRIVPEIIQTKQPEPAPAPPVTAVLPSQDTSVITVSTPPIVTPLQVEVTDTAQIDTKTTLYAVTDTAAPEKSAEPLPIEPATILEVSLVFDDIFFDEGQSTAPSTALSPYYYATLGKVIKVWKNYPDCYLRLKGHIGSSKPEQQIPELDLKRALTVGKLILELFPKTEQEGIAAQIEPVGADFSEMLVPAANKCQDAFNRRVSIELIKGDLPSKTLTEYLKTTTQSYPSTPIKKATPTQPGVMHPISSTQALYDNALKLFEQKRYPAAIASFQEVVELNPRHSLADNAQWWIGEAYYAQGDYQKALEAFQKVFGLGDGNKSAYAQLRLGYCYFHLAQKEAARTALQQVIARYPQASEEVVKARKMLQTFAEK